ncbi:hypothetical protein FRC11_013206 [Ceratobasidium sp. 423]|nr:hypothetical protein FRC11_013206 [Ceratobasidium sp. 423]
MKLHFAATSPNQRALTFEGSSGAVYTQALQNVVLNKGLSLASITTKIQHNMDELLKQAGNSYAQQHRVSVIWTFFGVILMFLLDPDLFLTQIRRTGFI